jgi:hypothetical protein
MHASGTPAKEWRGRYPEGAMVRHIASGAKHFKATRPEHTTVRDTLAVDGAFDPNVFDRRAFDVPRLVIELENGTTEDILDVAERVLAHWQATIK